MFRRALIMSLHTMNSRIPVIIVLGSTGSGKSKLGIEIASRFNGEIISADSIQVYKGLDIISNKVTKEELQQVSHHMLDFLDPLARYTVIDYRNQALRIIERLIQENKVPVVVGGTNYYIESLLFKVLVEDFSEETELLFEKDEKLMASQSFKRKKKDISKLEKRFRGEENVPENAEGCDDVKFEDLPQLTQDSVTELSSETLHKCLQEIDPDRANFLHPRDRRKIIRSLQVFQQHGKPHSKLLQHQKETDGGNSLGGPLRYPNTHIFWLKAEQAALDKRLDSRVDDMLSRGLVNELEDFHRKYNEQRLKENVRADYTKGIFQSIGFKEFHEYLMLSDSQKRENNGQRLLNEGIEALKQVTKRYARKQVKWIKNRFLRRPDRPVPPVYGLDVTDLDKWTDHVLQPALSILDAITKGRASPYPPLPVTYPEEENVIQTYVCTVCQRSFVGTLQWKAHEKSKKHWKMVRRKKLLECGVVEQSDNLTVQ